MQSVDDVLDGLHLLGQCRALLFKAFSRLQQFGLGIGYSLFILLDFGLVVIESLSGRSCFLIGLALGLGTLLEPQLGFIDFGH